MEGGKAAAEAGQALGQERPRRGEVDADEAVGAVHGAGVDPDLPVTQERLFDLHGRDA